MKQVMTVRIYGAMGADEKIRLYRAFFTESKYVIVFECEEGNYINDKGEVITEISIMEKDLFESFLNSQKNVVVLHELQQELLPMGGYTPDEIVEAIRPENKDKLFNSIVQGEGFQEWTDAVYMFFKGVESKRLEQV